MSKYLLTVIGILVILLIVAGISFKLQVETNAEQKVIIANQQAALRMAEEARQKAEKAISDRDAAIHTMNSQMANYRARMRSLEKQYAEIDEWSRTRIPEPVHRLLCDLTHSRSEACVPASDSDSGKTHTRVGGSDKWGSGGVGDGSGESG